LIIYSGLFHIVAGWLEAQRTV